MKLTYTVHAEERMQQRGMRKGDEEFIVELGTQIDDETWILLDRDARRAIEERKREIQRLDRLANRKVIMRGERLITAYPSCIQDQKRTLRRGREKGVRL